MKITVTRALVELKTLTDRIEKLSADQIVAATVVSPIGSAPQGAQSQAAFVAKADAAIQSVRDLIERRASIKAAVVASNAITTVTIGDTPMTVAAAIEYKAMLPMRRVLLDRLTLQLRLADQKCEMLNAKVRDVAHDKVVALLGGPDKAKTDPSTYAGMIKAYVDQHGAEVVAATNLEEMLKVMERNLSIAETTLDVVLSESNSTTFVEV